MALELVAEGRSGESADEADDGGTPFPTEFDETPMKRIASHCIGFDGLNKPVKISQVLGQPHIMSEITSQYAIAILRVSLRQIASVFLINIAPPQPQQYRD